MTQSSTSIVLLVIFAIVYCSGALVAPFWSENDTWSNILPVIQYRQSIIEQHILPLHTNLWYGGWKQIQNPLSSFLYPPATIIWLLTPLDWGTRLVFLGHLIFALIAGWKLGSIFLSGGVERASIAIILVSPMLPALIAGHTEKVMAWGWVLFAIYFLLNSKFSPIQRGLGAGTCWGIIALTGANYYVLYQGIILIPLALSIKNKKLFISFFLGSLLGLLHLPSIWHLIGHSRSISDISKYSSDPLSILTSLATGYGRPFGWEGWALIGIPIVYLFARSIFVDIKSYISLSAIFLSQQKVSLLFSLTILFLLATGSLYKGHSLLDTFRVPSRALAFIGLGCTLYVLLSLLPPYSKTNNGTLNSHFKLLLILSAFQIGIMSWPIRPTGALHSPYDSNMQNLANILKEDNAESVWFSMSSLKDMYVHTALMRNGLSLPNVYYGDMGQSIPVHGDTCGYSFDHLIASPMELNSYIELRSDLDWINIADKISMDSLRKIEQITVNGKEYNIYRVTCQT